MMRKNNHSLLDEIVIKTYRNEISKPVVRKITNRQDFKKLNQTNISRSSGFKPVVSSSRNIRLFEEVFDEICFYFRQYRDQYENINAFNSEDREKTKRRLDGLLDFLEEAIEECHAFLFETLNSPSVKSIETASFILCSVEDQSQHDFIEKIINQMERSEKSIRISMGEGLKYGIHPEITEIINRLIISSSLELKSTLSNIVEFKKHYGSKKQ